MYKNNNMKPEFLQDTRNGKDNKWKERHLVKNDLAYSYKRIGSNKYYRVKDCSTFLEFRRYVDNEIKLNRANFCKIPLCPMCSWRRSMKIFGQMSKVMNYAEKNYNYKYIFLTLTVKNCYGEDLRDTLNLMTDSFGKLYRRKAFKQAVKGYFRSLEITYDSNEFITRDMYYGNHKKRIKSRKQYYDKRGLQVGDKNPNFNTYHPHFHIILAVNNSYFNDPKYYLSQEKWTSLWQSCLKVDYLPMVDVRVIDERLDKEVEKAVAETAKYAVKEDDFLIKDKHGNINIPLTDEVVKTLDHALHRKRLVSFGFEFKKIHKKLNLDDPEDGELNDCDIEDGLRKDIAYVLERYQWNIGYKNYILVEVAEPEEGDN